MKKPTLWYSVVLCFAIVTLSNPATAQMRSGKLGVGVGGSAYLFNSDIGDGLMKAGGGLTLSYSAMEHLGLRALFGFGQLGWKTPDLHTNTTTMLSGNLYLSYDMIPHGSFNPFIFVGGGAAYFDPRSDQGADLSSSNMAKFTPTASGGVGFDYFFSEFFSMTLSGEFVMTTTDKLDAWTITKNQGISESFSRVNLEFRYYFFDQDYITKLLEALQARYKGKQH